MKEVVPLLFAHLCRGKDSLWLTDRGAQWAAIDLAFALEKPVCVVPCAAHILDGAYKSASTYPRHLPRAEVDKKGSKKCYSLTLWLKTTVRFLRPNKDALKASNVLIIQTTSTQ